MTARECGPTHHACACMLERMAQLEDALERIATYQVPSTTAGVYRNTEAAEYARRVLNDQHKTGYRTIEGGRHGGNP